MSTQFDAHITAWNIHRHGSLVAFKAWAARKQREYETSRGAYRLNYPHIQRGKIDGN